MEHGTVFVTGSSGFIGSNLVLYLLKNGYQVAALDCRASFLQYDGKYNQNYTVINGDVRDMSLVRKILKEHKVDYIVHLAAVSTIQMGADKCYNTMNVNVDGTRAVLQAMSDIPCKGFIYASTDKVYGKLTKLAYTEDDPLWPLNSPYDMSKARADELVRKWAKERSIPGIVLRFCNIYGKYDLHDSRIIPHTIKTLLERRECILKVYRDDDGYIRNFYRDFLYVDDLCEVILKLLRKMELWNHGFGEQKWGEAFNLGALHCYSMDEVIWNIGNIMGINNPHIRLEFSSETLPEIGKQKMDFSKAKKYLGFSPKTTLEDGLRETVRWWKQYLKRENEKCIANV